MQASLDTKLPTVGTGEFQYQPVPGWEQLPEDWSLVEVAGLASDSQGNVYVYNRGEHPVIVFDRDGKFLRSWGEGTFNRPHGLHIGPGDTLYLSDDCDHTVKKYTAGGELLMTLGTSGEHSDTGMTDFDYRQVTHGSAPFYYPTNVALDGEGSLYITDGYGNARVHKFSAEGALLLSWGEPGEGPGQFNLPHGIAIDSNGRVYVADRENSLVQIFQPNGEFITEWTDTSRPMQVFIDSRDNVFVADVGRKVGLFPWQEAGPSPVGGRVSIFNLDGELQARWGGGENPGTPGDFLAPHDIWIDSDGSLSSVKLSGPPPANMAWDRQIAHRCTSTCGCRINLP